MADGDEAIRLTDADAAGARLSAVQKRYLDDPYIKLFVPRAHLQPARPPLINIGTFIRSTAIDDLVDQWLSLSHQSSKPCQIVSLGAGSDTRFWRIEAGEKKSTLARYWELDFPEITTKKAMAIKKNSLLTSALGEPPSVTLSRGGTALNSPRYHLLPVDLRSPPGETLSSLLESLDDSRLSPELPTLLLFECVLAYMQPSESDAVIQWFVDYFSKSKSPAPLGGIVYEMHSLQDSFGRVMVNNLKVRNVTLPGAEIYTHRDLLPTRFLKHKFAWARALDLKQIRHQNIRPEELERISTLEMLDEIEEMDLVLQHYAITWGLWLPSDFESSHVWNTWGLVQARQNASEED